MHKKELLAALITCHGVVTDACEQVDITRTQYYDYYKTDEAFKKAADETENAAIDFTKSKLFKNIEAEKEASIFFHLKCKGGFIERKAIELEHKGLPQKMVIGGQEIDFS